MAKIIVGISEMAISSAGNDELITHSLGSCLGIAFYDRERRIGGLLHCMLPLSANDPKRAEQNPAMFVDSGTTALLEQMIRQGCSKKNIVSKVAGGARVLDRQDLFRIGERNYTVFRKILWKNSMLIEAEDVGGGLSRTVRLEVETGRFFIRSGSEEKVL